MFTAFRSHSFASQDLNELLAKQGFPEVKVLYRTDRIVVLKVLKSADPNRWGRVYTCLLPDGPCVEGYPTYMKDNKILLIRGRRVLELNLRSTKEKILENLPAIARIGKDKTVEIVHEGRTVKVKDPFPKHWVYPKERGIVPCGDMYWTWESSWNLFVNREGHVTKKKGKQFVCIFGKVVDLEKDGKVVTFKPARSVIKRVNRTLFRGNPSVRFFKGFVVLLGNVPGSYAARMVVLSPNLKLKAQVDLGEVFIRLLVLSRGKFYITMDTFDMGKDWTGLYRLDPEKGSLEKILSYERRNNYEYYLFTPIGEGKYIRIKPPYSVCLFASGQGECTMYRHYKGKASLVDLKGNVLRTIDLPKRSEVYPMDGAFVFCREECKFVNGRLEVKPLGFKGFSDRWRGEDVKVFSREEEAFVVFRDGTNRRIPRGCRVRVHSRTVFCLYGRTKAELRDLETWEVLGESSAVPYPDHVYGRFVLKGRIMVLEAGSGRVVDYRRLECEGMPPRDIVFNRDRFYVIYSGDQKVCMEVFKIDVD